MGHKITDFPLNVQEQIKNELRKSKVQIGVAIPASDRQPDTRHAPAPSARPEKGDERYVFAVHEFRYKLHDPDAGWSKWVLDSLVTHGILHDDDSSIIQEVRHKQTKIPKDQIEYTVIELIETA